MYAFVGGHYQNLMLQVEHHVGNSELLKQTHGLFAAQEVGRGSRGRTQALASAALSDLLLFQSCLALSTCCSH